MCVGVCLHSCRFNIDGLIIDPYNELDPSRTSGFKEHEHVNQTMAMLRKFARDYKVGASTVDPATGSHR